MMSAKAVLEKIKEEIRPDAKKMKEVEDLIKKIALLLKKQKLKAKIQAGGSYAKGTFLKNIHDIDLFVAFDLLYKGKDISTLLEKVLKPLKAIRLHGSRDYFQIKKGYSVEIIPVLDIKKATDAENVTDFSLRHVTWMKKEGKGQEDDIRLAKQFCKAEKIYGAESYLSGFSGHVLDILIIYYKGFLNLLKKSRTWKTQQVIDYYQVHKGKAKLNMNTSKLHSGLIVVDPVQPGRNAAAALSEENMKKFQERAATFLKRPSPDFFIEKKIDQEALKKKKALMINAKTEEGKKDVIGAKAVKVFQYLKNKIAESFGIQESGWEWNDHFLMWFIPEQQKLSSIQEHEGPPLDKKDHALIFKKKYKKTKIKNGRIIAYVKRTPLTLEEYVTPLLKQPYVKERVATIKIIR